MMHKYHSDAHELKSLLDIFNEVVQMKMGNDLA